MTPDQPRPPPAGIEVPGESGRFAATRWSVVVDAGKDGDAADRALETLYRIYWRPLYVYVRGRGYSREDAEDMTQAFLVHLMNRRDALANADPKQGRFRSFLLASMNHFLADEWDKAHAQKRGGGQVFAMDFQGAETWLSSLASSEITPEEAFERKWALTLLEHVFRRLQDAYHANGKETLFDVLKPTLSGPREAASGAELAAQLHMTEGAVRVAIHRLRRDYRELLRNAIADLVADPEDVEDELRHLQRALSRGHSSRNES